MPLVPEQSRFLSMSVAIIAPYLLSMSPSPSPTLGHPTQIDKYGDILRHCRISWIGTYNARVIQAGASINIIAAKDEPYAVA
ncbi:hypothetical protein BDZ45DRAFT_808663 [Acephala macrosclerotiorum]|nr:hypothetical protein BDZ45DRAFT_808663 [Acephala macrosclerotiorum]